MADENRKRKAPQGDSESNKKNRTKKQWRMPRKNEEVSKQRNILPGDSGIWATCDKGREGKCTGELRDLFNEYAELLYPDALAAEAAAATEDADDDGDGEINIEAEIQQELEDIRKPQTKPLFVTVKLDVQCVLFFKTRAPIEPVSFVRRICEDAAKNPQLKRTRFCKRLSPMTIMGKANEEGLAKVASQVLAPHFHQDPPVSQKFAIRPTLRNHNVLKRDDVIRQVASAVGQGHKVDLKNPDLLVMVEIYTSICGMSVIPNDYEALKRYNLAEIFDPTPKEQPKDKAKESRVEAKEPKVETEESKVKTEAPEIEAGEAANDQSEVAAAEQEAAPQA